jgi:two-component system, chemotaxis family, chemotaxis protein CheY
MSRILVIDDDEALRCVLRTALSRAGFAVDTADDGCTGMMLFRALHPDLVVTDIRMPKKDGLETMRDIRAIDPAAPIIAIAGEYAESGEYLAIARALGADAVLAKPFLPADLVAKVAGRLRS